MLCNVNLFLSSPGIFSGAGWTARLCDHCIWLSHSLHDWKIVLLAPDHYWRLGTVYDSSVSVLISHSKHTLIPETSAVHRRICAGVGANSHTLCHTYALCGWQEVKLKALFTGFVNYIEMSQIIYYSLLCTAAKLLRCADMR